MGKVIRGAWEKVEQSTKGTASIYQLKVVLLESQPPIWRRLLVPGNVTLETLHHILQFAMGWTGGHLFVFDIKGEQYSLPEFELEDTLNARRTKLLKIAATPRTKFRYEYDMGDGWLHEITVEKIAPAEAGQQYPSCVEGQRACPPEDCGGIRGYEELLQVIGDPKHPEHEERKEWLVEDFDPEAFDLAEINKRLKPIE